MVPLGDVKWPPHGAGDKENGTIQVKSITEAVDEMDPSLPGSTALPHHSFCALLLLSC